MFDEDVMAKTKETCPECGSALYYVGFTASYVCYGCDYERPHQ